jgi:hypothetical protein
MRWFVTLAIVTLFLAACGEEVPVAPTSQPSVSGTTSSVTTPVAGTATSAYPVPAEAYPGPAAAGGYPAPAPTLQPGPDFTLNTPVKAADAEVSGSGPPGVPIKLIDISNSGETIAENTIGSDGTFKFDVSGKLVAGNSIALKLGSVEGTGLDPNSFLSGPGYSDMPFVGTIFDSTVVQ